MGTIKSLTPEEHKILKEDFWDKNKRLARPLSPHLGIYKVINNRVKYYYFIGLISCYRPLPIGYMLLNNIISAIILSRLANQWEMTMVLSITHRGTGLMQSALMTGFAIFPFVTSQSYPAVLAQVAELGLASAPLLFVAKFAIVWPVMFHLFNGFRHLVSIASKFRL